MQGMRAALVGLFFCLIAPGGRAMELGQTKDAIRAQHGPATEENHSKNTAVYRAGIWKVDVEYKEGVACRLTFTRIGQLTEAEIQSILSQNAGGAEWHEMATTGAKRSWQRSDFAAAECDRMHPRSMTFVQAPPTAEISAPPAMVEAEPSSTPAEESRPAFYATEQPPLVIAPQKPADGLVAIFGTFVDGHPLVFVIPALLLLIVWLLKRTKGSAAPPVSPRRIVTPRVANDAMATESVESTLDNLEPEAFELLIGEIFRRQGWSVEMSGGIGSDGGCELTLRKPSELILVQCRHWTSWKVSAPSVQEFYGTIMASGATDGIFVTSGRYTRDARALAEGKPIRLIDRVELDRLISSVAAPGENLCDLKSWIDRFASTVSVMDPSCPFCGQSMKLKRGIQGRPFWSCRTFPRCGGKRDGRIELLRARPLSTAP
jgi:HJR/Mrr/RecB family endonuclease